MKSQNCGENIRKLEEPPGVDPAGDPAAELGALTNTRTSYQKLEPPTKHWNLQTNIGTSLQT
jgi:hypothetical protein